MAEDSGQTSDRDRDTDATMSGDDRKDKDN